MKKAEKLAKTRAKAKKQKLNGANWSRWHNGAKTRSTKTGSKRANGMATRQFRRRLCYRSLLFLRKCQIGPADPGRAVDA